MNKKAKIITLIAIAIITLNSNLQGSHQPSMYMGNIQFPSTLSKTPAVRLYFAGNKIVCTSNDEHKKVSFNVAPIQPHIPLYLLIIEQVQWEADENTIKYLKTDPRKPYRFYRLHFDGSTGNWSLKEKALNGSGQIPDNTIIVIIAPDWIDKIEGGNRITLPTIYLRQNLVDLIGSEVALQNTTQALLLGAIDSDSIHKKREQVVKRQCKIKTVLALTT
jgi:hypothetical protein